MCVGAPETAGTAFNVDFQMRKDARLFRIFGGWGMISSFPPFTYGPNAATAGSCFPRGGAPRRRRKGATLPRHEPSHPFNSMLCRGRAREALRSPVRGATKGAILMYTLELFRVLTSFPRDSRHSNCSATPFLSISNGLYDISKHS